MTEYIGGWLYEDEDWDELDSLEGESNVLLMRGNYQELAFDPREVMKVEQQGPVGACQGHSLSSTGEFSYMIATSDLNLQLSRAMGYYETQRIDRISGDRGSTITGGIQLITTVGICEESLWPYTARYDNRRPRDWSAVTENAAKYKIYQTPRMESYEGIRTFLGSGQGAVHIGIRWGGEMATPVL